MNGSSSSVDEFCLVDGEDEMYLSSIVLLLCWGSGGKIMTGCVMQVPVE